MSSKRSDPPKNELTCCERRSLLRGLGPAMIEAVTAELQTRDFKTGKPGDPETDIHVERYW